MLQTQERPELVLAPNAAPGLFKVCAAACAQDFKLEAPPGARPASESAIGFIGTCQWGGSYHPASSCQCAHSESRSLASARAVTVWPGAATGMPLPVLSTSRLGLAPHGRQCGLTAGGLWARAPPWGAFGARDGSGRWVGEASTGSSTPAAAPVSASVRVYWVTDRPSAFRRFVPWKVPVYSASLQCCCGLPRPTSQRDCS
jgi:hypothetical protein